MIAYLEGHNFAISLKQKYPYRSAIRERELLTAIAAIQRARQGRPALLARMQMIPLVDGKSAAAMYRNIKAALERLNRLERLEYGEVHKVAEVNPNGLLKVFHALQRSGIISRDEDSEE